jgi:hypothetical protein
MGCKFKSSEKSGTPPAQPPAKSPGTESMAPQNSNNEGNQAINPYPTGSSNYPSGSTTSSNKDFFLRRSDFTPSSATLLSQDDLKRIINNSDAFLSQKSEIFNIVLFDFISPCFNATLFNLPLTRTVTALEIKTETNLANCINPVEHNSKSINLIDIKARVFFSIDLEDDESAISVQAQTLKQFTELNEFDRILAKRGSLKFVFNAKIDVTYREGNEPSAPLQRMEILRAQMDPMGDFCRIEKRDQGPTWAGDCYFSYLRKRTDTVELAITLVNHQNSVLFNPASHKKESGMKIIFNSWIGDIRFPTTDQLPTWSATDTQNNLATGTYTFDDKNLY